MDFSEFSDILRTVFADNGISEHLGERESDMLFQLTERLLETNEKMNLTAIRDVRGVVVKHFADCLLAARFLPQNARLLDVGCGAGFPSLPFAVCRPDLAVTALDSTEKKVRFVQETAAALGLRLTATAGRAEELAHGPWRETFDAVTARAVAALPVLCELCLPFVRVGGVFLALKGARAEEEVAAAQNAAARLGGEIRAVHSLTLRDAATGLFEPRGIVEIVKIAPTPQTYPRAFAKIDRAPL